MPSFLVPIAAALISSFFGNKASKQANKRTSAEKLMEQLMLDQSQKSGVFGQDMMARATDTMTGAQNFWQSALQGDRGTLMSLYGPQIADMQAQSREAYRTQQQIAPRTGASAEYLSSMPQQRLLNENRLLAGAKPMAADRLGEMGTNYASLGLNAMSQGRSGASDLLNYSQGRREYGSQQGGGTAEAIYGLINDIYSQYSKSKGTGTSGGGGGRGTMRGNWWEKYPQGNDKNAPWWGS